MHVFFALVTISLTRIALHLIPFHGTGRFDADLGQNR